MPRRVERWTKVPKDRAPQWFRSSMLARGIGMELFHACEGEPIAVTEDWRTDLCRLLMVPPSERGNVARTLDRMVEAELLIVADGYVTVLWSAPRPVPVRSESGASPVPVRSPSAPSPVPVRHAEPYEIIKDTSTRQTDRQTEETAQHTRANGFDHSGDQKLVLRCWHEVVGTTEVPRADRLEQVTAACVRQASAETVPLEGIARRAFARFLADPYTAQAKNRFALLASQVEQWTGPPPALAPPIPITREQRLNAAFETDIRGRLAKLSKIYDDRIARAEGDPERQARLAHEKKLEVWKLEAKLA